MRFKADATWKLMPSVLRGLRPDAENNIISELMAEAPSEFADDKTMFGRLVRAQHYGLPTRLLDVSLNPLVALFFACSDEPHLEKDGKVLILDFIKSSVKYPDSDTISLICNLSRLSDNERDELRVKGLDKDISQDQFNNSSAAKRLTQFVRMEKPYFQNNMKTVDFRKYFSFTRQRPIDELQLNLAHLLRPAHCHIKIRQIFILSGSLPSLYRQNLRRKLSNSWIF